MEKVDLQPLKGKAETVKKKRLFNDQSTLTFDLSLWSLENQSPHWNSERHRNLIICFLVH